MRVDSFCAAAPRMIVLAIAALILAGCTRSQPHGVAERYIEDLQQFNYDATYHLLAAQDRKDRTLREFLTEIPLAPEVSPIWFRPVLHKMHYELGPERRNSDGVTATVPVRITMPDLPLWERVMDAAAGPGDIGAERAQRSLDTGDYPKVTYDDTFYLVKEHHHWRVVAGFGERDSIVDRHRQAVAQYHEHDFAGAVATYKSLIADLEKQQATGSRSLAERYAGELAAIQKVIAQQGATTAYMPRLKLDQVSVKMSEERVPAVFGTITNTGHKPLDEVTLAVTWYQGRGRETHEVHREVHPVITTPLQFTDFDRSVLPFTPGETRNFGFILSAPALVEQEASPYVSIDSIAFTQSAAPLPEKRTAAASPKASPEIASSMQNDVGTKLSKPAAPPTGSPHS
jgi:hypothetical protein